MEPYKTAETLLCLDTSVATTKCKETVKMLFQEVRGIWFFALYCSFGTADRIHWKRRIILFHGTAHPEGYRKEIRQTVLAGLFVDDVDSINLFNLILSTSRLVAHSCSNATQLWSAVNAMREQMENFRV